MVLFIFVVVIILQVVIILGAIGAAILSAVTPSKYGPELWNNTINHYREVINSKNARQVCMRFRNYKTRLQKEKRRFSKENYEDLMKKLDDSIEYARSFYSQN